MLVRDADHGTVDHGRECIDDFLDLSWRDVLTAADDEFLESTGNGQKTVLVRFRQITRVIPAVAEGIACRSRLIVIFGLLAGICSFQHIGSKFLNRTRLVGISPRNSAK
jgi:hypothetical protein